MFKKKCPKCENKIEKKFDYCPYCGKDLKGKYDDKDYGFLGKNDFIEDGNMGFLGGSFVDKIINSAMKMMEKQLRDLPNNVNERPNNFQGNVPGNMKIKFMVNGKEVPLGQPKRKQEAPKKVVTQISQEKAERIAKFPRKEPKAIMKRLSGKIIYELAVPGVKDIKDVLINQLESSIEIKAIAKDKVYLKTINVNLPVLRCMLEKGNLIVEFQGR
jgi:hypothetical protein